MRAEHLIAAATAILIGTSSAHAASWAITDVNVPGSSFTQTWGINNSGVIVGGDDFGGFIDTHGTFETINAPGAASTTLTGISSSGLAVGTTETDSFFYQAGTFTSYSVAGAALTTLRSISPNGRYAAGTYSTATDTIGFVYDITTATRTDITAPAGHVINVVQGVNDLGQVTGSLNGGLGLVYDLSTHTTTTYTASGDLSQYRFRAINDEGLIGGWAVTSADGGTVGIIGTPDSGFTIFDGAPDGGSTIIYGLNDVGEAIGFYTDVAGISHGFLATLAVPEPTSTASMALALLVMGARLARRRKVA